jgi:DNA mismatch endonuclease, patch repair protein
MPRVTHVRGRTHPYPKPTTTAATSVMRANTRQNTQPELRIRSLLHSTGVRYRVNRRLVCGELRTRPDIIFHGRKIAVFVDGCFWHMCPKHGTRPRSNPSYWDDKLRGNVERDARVNRALRNAGWTVLRVWEHSKPETAVARILRTLQKKAKEKPMPVYG